MCGKGAMTLENTFCSGWKFLKGDATGAHQAEWDDTTWETVEIPHDWSVESEFDQEKGEGCTGYLLGGLGWYRKSFETTREMIGKNVFVVFDGVYNNADFYLNGHWLGFHPYGYSPFYYDLTPYLAPLGKNNILAVRVDHTRYADSRWYTGSGIYREVKLVILPQIYIPIWGVKIETPVAKRSFSSVRVKIQLKNQLCTDQKVVVRGQISGEGLTETAEQSNILIDGGSSTVAELNLWVQKPRLWDVDDPYLYSLSLELLPEGTTVQKLQIPFGIRECRFDCNQGFFLNEKNMKIKGVCLHHDAGLTGAAVTESVWRRRLKILKECGCNAIRSSHNPASDILLTLCDEMGFLVQEEFFDEWDNPKDKRFNGNEKQVDAITRGYQQYFQEWAKTDLQTAILRDQNHPCIFQWSIGNEIEWTYPKYNLATGYFDANASGNYFWTLPPYSLEKIRENIRKLPRDDKEIGDTAKKLVKWVKELDHTRPVTANCILPSASYESGYIDALDIVGYSYRRVIYDYGHQNYPDKPIMGTENVAQWHEWKAVIERPFIAGMFIWTGFDYLGEAGEGHGVTWPVKSSNSGMVDFAGFPKPSYYMIQSLWQDTPMVKLYTQSLEKAIYQPDFNGEIVEKEGQDWQKRLWRWHDVNDFWNYPNGTQVIVEVYSNCDEVELFVNGKSLGIQKLCDQADRVFKWCVPYESGSLQAEGRKNGQKVFDRLITETGAHAIVFTCEDGEISRMGEYLHCIAQVVDAYGNPVRNQECDLHFETKGALELIGVDNGAHDSVQPYQSERCTTHLGRCLVIVKRTGKESSTLTVTSGTMKASISWDHLP